MSVSKDLRYLAFSDARTLLGRETPVDHVLRLAEWLLHGTHPDVVTQEEDAAQQAAHWARRLEKATVSVAHSRGFAWDELKTDQQNQIRSETLAALVAFST